MKISWFLLCPVLLLYIMGSVRYTLYEYFIVFNSPILSYLDSSFYQTI